MLRSLSLENISLRAIMFSQTADSFNSFLNIIPFRHYSSSLSSGEHCLHKCPKTLISPPLTHVIESLLQNSPPQPVHLNISAPQSSQHIWEYALVFMYLFRIFILYLVEHCSPFVFYFIKIDIIVISEHLFDSD